MTISAVRIHPDDNVACLLHNLDKGACPELVDMTAPSLTAAVPMGHKVALVAIEAGAAVVKYGSVIGHATCAIAPGDHVHLHNLEGASR